MTRRGRERSRPGCPRRCKSPSPWQWGLGHVRGDPKSIDELHGPRCQVLAKRAASLRDCLSVLGCEQAFDDELAELVLQARQCVELAERPQKIHSGLPALLVGVNNLDK